ncbi:MAG: phosphohydrolase, partial [Pseudomonadota bacterium]
RTGDVTRHYLLCDYAARWLSEEPQAGDDAADAQFVALKDLSKFELWEETRRIIDAARHLV